MMQDFISKYRSRQQDNSLEINYYLSSVTINYHIAINEYIKAIKTADIYLRYFSTKTTLSGVEFNIQLKKGICQISSGKHNEAAFTLSHAEKLRKEGTYNKNLCLLYRSIQALHAGKYAKARDIYLEGAKKCKWSTIGEQWNIIHAILYILKHSGDIELPHQRFSLGKFLNEVPLSSQDETGQNTSLIITQLVILLQKNKRDAFIDRSEAAKAYSYKYLKGPGMNRARLIIRMIAEIPKHDFNLRMVDRVVVSKHHRLKRSPLSIGYHFELETIPFEKLWEVIRKKNRCQQCYTYKIISIFGLWQ